MDIDYVVPMVFDDDEQWRKDYVTAHHVLRYGGGNVRYRSWGNEELLIRCIRKFMPFVRTIYIILARESQKKAWMDGEHFGEAKGTVRVVYHREFVPEKYLPCFNSCTLEMFVPFIEGLSEHFIYGNDDMFPVSPLKETDFFVNGLPVQHLSEKAFPDNPSIFHKKCKNQQKMIASSLGIEIGDTHLHNGHNLAPMLRSSCLEVREIFDKEITDGITPYRSETSYNQYLYVLWQHFTGRYVDGRAKSTYVSVKEPVSRIREVICKSKGVVCVNDNERAGDISEHAALVRRILNEKLMSKKESDYRIWVTYHRDELVSQYGLLDDDHHKLFASHKDIEGKNINHLNPVYSEMVTMWYVWKNNIKSEYIGFEHYRRHLNIRRMPRKGECQVFRAINFGKQTIYEQYAKCHNVKDIDVMLGILGGRFGKSNPYARHITEDSVLIANCTFLMKWTDFKKLCEFMFPLLEDFAVLSGIRNNSLEEWNNKAQKDFGNNRTAYQMRVVSFLAERLISAWINTHMKWWNGIDVAIVHYNTPELTDAAIRSLNKFTPGCRVTIFDNSNEKPFVNSYKNVSVIDNTKGQIIDFEEILSHYPDKELSERNKSDFGSAKHCKSVDILMDYIPDGFLLMDSDVLVTNDVRKLVRYDVAVSGMEHTKDGVTLFQPFLCWINVPMLRVNDIRYFNGDKMWALSRIFPNNRYDTGAWLFEEVRNKNLEWLAVDIWRFIIHFGHGSWRDKNGRAWLEEHKDLYE